jgi:uncharacterized membrane protein
MSDGRRPSDARRVVQYWPVPARFVLAFFVVAALTASVIAVNVVSYAYARLGLPEAWAVAVLLGSIVGSRFNIPVARLRGTTTLRSTLVRAFGMLYVVPRLVVVGTKIVAVNVGGALIPTALSAYLILHDDLGWRAVFAVGVVSVVTHLVARVIPGVGIVVPTFVPPVTAAVSVWALGGGVPAALAYVARTLGTLIGADVLNLHGVRDLDAPILSIGGAGTFDGIFVTGILAVLLAVL